MASVWILLVTLGLCSPTRPYPKHISLCCYQTAVGSQMFHTRESIGDSTVTQGLLVLCSLLRILKGNCSREMTDFKCVHLKKQKNMWSFCYIALCMYGTQMWNVIGKSSKWGCPEKPLFEMNTSAQTELLFDFNVIMICMFLGKGGCTSQKCSE